MLIFSRQLMECSSGLIPNESRVFHKSLNVAVTGPALRWGCVSLQSRAEDGFCSALIPPVGQDRLILTRFTAHPQAIPNYRIGLDAFRYSPARQGGRHSVMRNPPLGGYTLPPWGDLRNRNGVRKHPQMNQNSSGSPDPEQVKIGWSFSNELGCLR